MFQRVTYNCSGIASGKHNCMSVTDDVGFSIHVWFIDMCLKSISQHIFSVSTPSIDPGRYIVSSKLSKLLKFSGSLAETRDKAIDPWMSDQWEHVGDLPAPSSSEY
jgi:hypothetical protein